MNVKPTNKSLPYITFASIDWNALNQGVGGNGGSPTFSTDDSLNFIGQLLGGPSEGKPGILAIAIVLGGILLMVMLVSGGFTMLSNPTNPQAQDKGKAQITYAIAGFAILFLSYWIAQILQVIFGISIVS